MASKMTHTVRAELAEAMRRRYRAAAGKEKRRILDEFVVTTGYHEKSAIRSSLRQTVASSAADSTASLGAPRAPAPRSIHSLEGFSDERSDDRSRSPHATRCDSQQEASACRARAAPAHQNAHVCRLERAARWAAWKWISSRIMGAPTAEVLSIVWC
jgi:hypothetical protein